MANKKPSTQAPASKESVLTNGALLWGVQLIVLGVVILLGNLGFIDVNLGALWQIWPVFIILAGLSVLRIRGLAGKVVTIIATLLIAGLIVAVTTGPISTTSNVKSEDFSISQKSKINKAEVRLESSAGKLNIGSHSGPEIVEGRLDGQRAELQQESSVDGQTQVIDLSVDSRGWWQPTAASSLTANLTRDLPMDLLIDGGASKIEADLSQVLLENLEIDAGVSSTNIKLGERSELTRVKIDTGVSSMKISVPKDVGVRVQIDSGASSHDLPSEFTEQSDGVYQSKDYEDSSKKIIINISMGVSSFELTTY